MKQLTVFLENRQGRLVEVTEMLAEKNVDLRALSIADTADFGILRLIVDDPEFSKKILEDAGMLVQITEVVGAVIPDRPGELSRALKLLDGAGINLEYLYAFLAKADDNAHVVFRVADNQAATSLLRQAGFEIL